MPKTRSVAISELVLSCSEESGSNVTLTPIGEPGHPVRLHVTYDGGMADLSISDCEAICVWLTARLEAARG